MVNLFLKYFWMYMLMGLIINIGVSIGFTVYCGCRLNWHTEPMEKIMDIIGGIGYSKFIDSLIKSEEGRLAMLGAFVCTQIIWPANVAHILMYIPETNEVIKEYQQNLGRQA